MTNTQTRKVVLPLPKELGRGSQIVIGATHCYTERHVADAGDQHRQAVAGPGFS